MRPLLPILAAVLVLAIIPSIACADGKVIPPTANAKVTIPDQEALIHYADGVETLVVETRFVGSGTNFAWVVPVPSRPEVLPATTGLFPTLRWLTRPAVVHNVPHLYIGALIVSLVLFLLLIRKYTAVLGIIFVILIYSCLMLPSLGSAGAASATPSSAVQVHERQIVGSFDTATLSSQDPDALLRWLRDNGFAAPPEIAPPVAQYVKEGWFFVAAKLHRDKDSAAPATPHPLGFRFKTGKPVYPLRLTGTDNERCAIDLYVFGPGRAVVPGFAVSECYQPTYPRLDEKADVDPSLKFPPQTDVVHPLLRKIVDGAPVATKLGATLTPEQMREDAYLGWTPFKATHQTLYSHYAVGMIALDGSVTILAVGIVMVLGLFLRPRFPFVARKGDVSPGLAALVLGFAIIWTAATTWVAVLSRRYVSSVLGIILLAALILVPVLVAVGLYWRHARRRRRKSPTTADAAKAANVRPILSWPLARRWLAGVVVASIIAALWPWLALPSTEVHVVKGGRFASIRLFSHLARLGENLASDATLGTDIDAKWARKWLAHWFFMEGMPPALTGDQLREEDSPGNYLVRDSDGRTEFVWYDDTGAAYATVVAGKPPAPVTMPSDR